MAYRAYLLAAASAASLWAGQALAQTAPSDTAVEEIVVTGTRAANRSRLETLAPVDVIDNAALTRQGTGTELAQSLSSLAPAIDFPRPAITDGTDHVRPATLRGLAPDQTLVLINGIRGHIGALVNVNGSIGRGSTAFDLNTVPAVALGSVEILRDGASAQYGADAIAGVINLRLREASSGGGVTYNYGVYNTTVETARGSRDAKDGVTQSVAAWQGFSLPNDGFLTVSGEYANRQPTNRSDYLNLAALPNYGTAKVIGRFGDPKVESYSLWANAGLPLNDVWSLYGYAGYQHRDSESPATARPYNSAGNLTAVYPGGYLPIIAAEIKDYTTAGGIKGEVAGWATDLSVSWGKNELDYHTNNSINVTYGPSSPKNFYAGALAYDQTIVDLDVSRGFEVGFAEPLNVAWGLQYRDEGFKVSPGQPESYSKGPFAGAPLSQGFGGFRPSNAIDISRHNWSAYVDLEGQVTDKFLVGAAGRYEDYSDFGSKGTGKLSARYDFTPAFALRGAISSGVKSPALQQQYFSYTATNLVTTVIGGQPVSTLIESGKFRVNDPVALALGAKPLKPETSVNYSLGAVIRAAGFDVTVDAYRIEIKDRIVLSDNLGVVGPNQSQALVDAIQTILSPFGVSAAQFFLNGVETTTQGVDVVARYRWNTDTLGRFDFTGAANFNHTDVTRTPDLPLITSASQPAFLFDRGNVLSYERGTPQRKLVATVDWSNDNWGASLKATNYDSVLVPNNNPSLDYETGSATLVDIEGRYTLPKGVGLALGVNNLFDEYPNATPATINSPTGSVGFPSYSPFGFNGRFLYGRISYNW
ncbi:MAG: TonB-dependent receptor [Caulobacterales bacterium]|nr:TonB-dependent receptor [Caulobacterales bacterium]